MPYSAKDFEVTAKPDAVVDDYIRQRPNSRALHERAVACFPAMGASHMGRIYNPFLMYCNRAEGSHKWDVDGNQYIDYFMGHGALILGHQHPEIVRAVTEQVATGMHYAANHAMEVDWAERVKALVPSIERIEFTACGQEGDMLAVRLARIFTGRKKILKFVGHYHGWNDELLVNGAGVVAEHTTEIPHDLNALEHALATEQYAVLMMEGGGASMGGAVPMDAGFAAAAGDLARKYGAVWVIDEVVTGFRDSVSGWQGLCGLQPDLTVLGKCIAAGVPAGAVGGRADIMSLLNPVTAGERWLMHGGTWNANPMQCAAGIAACALYADGEPQRRAGEVAASFRAKGNKVLQDLGVNARLYGRSIVHLYLGEIECEAENDSLPPVSDYSKIFSQEPQVREDRTRLSLHLHQQGIATALGRMFIFSQAHDEDDVEQTVRALVASVETMQQEGSWTIG